MTQGHVLKPVIGGRDAPFEHKALALDWYDGGNSALYIFGMGNTVAPAKLIREIKVAIAENNYDVERPKLAAFLAWAVAAGAKAELLYKVGKAMHDALSGGVNPYDIRQAIEAAGWHKNI